MNTNLRLKTAQAADVAGVGYEGFRTWPKRGLLKNTGVLPKFYASHVEAEITDAKRWRWSAFGFADLCCFRLAKLMLDAGLPWNMACTVASNQQLWQSFHDAANNIRYVAAFPKSDQCTLYSSEGLAADVAAEIVKHDWITLFELHKLRRDVVLRSRAVVLRALAAEMANTSRIFARTGPNMVLPAEAAARQAKIEELARALENLADDAETGAGSYREFEVILAGLHAEGKFPDNASVSAVALAFAG